MKKKERIIIVISILIIFCSLIAVASNIYQKKDNLYAGQATTNEVRNAIKDQNHVFVYYYQINCLHCKRVSPYLIPMGERINGKFLILNIEGDQKSWESYKINQTPTLVVYKNGRETNRIEGEQTKNKYKNFFNSES
ncbi:MULTISPECIES: thioredoxin family protein [Bacillus]|uniref:thioredoxin family protein n=1 Tax=Bacillus TaxID=1386 RepID=UPI000BEB1769|nr:MULTISPECIES: thioredoxin family protein [Bacillus amyloliquefaciens group]ATL41316.1 thiol reductase thioredoxin [Bacillus velezensis]MDR0141244.1 thioredoxin family protein [Bacillus velezensis]MEC1369084.1 thioredoxin family protein [Bacillus velezensis]MEC1565157.1 thioredoxin family protein [Bacillus velezensis]MEC2147815.1 thioredoxin family protein [Bacillus velezensis]